MEINLYILGLLCGIISYIAYKFRKLANYFYDRNIAYIPPIWPLGSDVKATLFRRHYCRSWDRIYKRLNGNKVGGFYILWKPILMVRDAEYVANVLTKDFTHFTDRGFVVDKKLNPLEGNLFFLDGAEWKYLRSKVTPGFTPEKLKSMFESLNFCSDKLVNEYIEKVAPLGEDVDFREPLARFTTDVICLCALGIRSETMDNPDSKYREIGKLFFNVDEFPAVYFFARFVLREIMSILKIRTVNKRITSFFNDIVQQVFHHRTTNRVSNHDFIQVLFDLREKNLKKEDSGKTVNGQVDTEKTPDEFNIDDTVLAAQLFLFFVAGFETTSTTLNTLLFYLSKNPECQEKARDEAKNVFESEGGTFTFNSLAKLKYLHNCVNETLRLVPPLPAHFRICTKDYTFPDGTEVEEGTTIVIPFHSIQRDPKYFSNPDEFNPKRFDGPIAPGSFTPFGEGQRVCIGKRFSIIEVKLTVAKILLTYKLKPSASHPDPFKWHPLSFMVLHEDPLLFKFEKINN